MSRQPAGVPVVDESNSVLTGREREAEQDPYEEHYDPAPYTPSPPPAAGGAYQPPNQFYPQTNQFPPPPNAGPYSPSPYNPADYPPPPGAAPPGVTGQPEYGYPPGGGAFPPPAEEQFRPRRADENVSAAPHTTNLDENHHRDGERRNFRESRRKYSNIDAAGINNPAASTFDPPPVASGAMPRPQHDFSAQQPAKSVQFADELDTSDLSPDDRRRHRRETGSERGAGPSSMPPADRGYTSDDSDSTLDDHYRSSRRDSNPSPSSSAQSRSFPSSSSSANPAAPAPAPAPTRGPSTSRRPRDPNAPPPSQQYMNLQNPHRSAPSQPEQKSRSSREKPHYDTHDGTTDNPTRSDSEDTVELPPRFDEQGNEIPQRGDDLLADHFEDLLTGRSGASSLFKTFLGGGGGDDRGEGSSKGKRRR